MRPLFACVLSFILAWVPSCARAEAPPARTPQDVPPSSEQAQAAPPSPTPAAPSTGGRKPAPPPPSAPGRPATPQPSAPVAAPPAPAPSSPAAQAPRAREPFYTWAVTGKLAPNVSLEGTPITRDALIMYEHDFGTYPRFYKGNPEHGGTPIEVNIDAHLAELRKDVEKYVPADFSGWAIIDYESWDPVYSACKEEYRQRARAIVRQRHPNRSDADIERLAKVAWESAARTFLERTIELCKQMRPKARWGYYGVPWGHQGEAARLEWLWSASDALYPNAYLVKPLSRGAAKPGEMPEQQYRDTVKLIFEQARRLAGPDKPVVAMIFLGYEHANPDAPARLTEQDLELALSDPIAAGADGIAIWDALDYPESDRVMNDYIRRVLGPALARRAGAQGPAR
jgi:hyaluronoglucosaminidase